MAPSSKSEKAQKEKEKMAKKLQSQKQKTLFDLKGYSLTQKKMKKVGRNQFKQVGEFICVETKTFENTKRSVSFYV